MDFHLTSLTCPQIKRHSTRRAGSAPAKAIEASPLKDANLWRESLSCLRQGYVTATIDCKQRSRRVIRASRFQA